MSNNVLYLGISIPINYMIGSYQVIALYSGSSQIWSAKIPIAFVKAEGNWTQNLNAFTSNKISHSHSTIEKVYFKNLGRKTITISYDVDSEKNYDYLTIFALDSETKVLATSKANGTANGPNGMVGSVDFTFPDNEEHFICFKYSKDGSGNNGRDNAIVTFPPKLFGEVKWVLVGEVIKYEYEDNALYKYIYQDLQLSFNGVLTDTHKDGALISKEPTTADIISPNDTIKLNDTPYGTAVPEVDPDTVYSLSFNSPTLIVFQSPIKISSWSIITKTNLTEIRGLNLVDTSNMTDMGSMFYDCQRLTSIDTSNFNTSKVTNMSYMFRFCRSLTSLDLSNFNTSSVTNMGYMFNYCRSLTSLNLSGWDTSKVTNMRAMFNDCRSLASLNLSGWDTSKVTNMSDMFWSCSKLTTITGPITGISASINLEGNPLTHDSAMVFLNGLNTVTGTKTITFKSTTYKTLTKAEIAAATAKGWTVKSAAY